MEKIEKVMIGKMPASAFPVVIVGSMVNGKPNYNTLGCYGLISPYPPTVYIKSIKEHYTNAGIRETGWFSVNLPLKELVEKTDYVGLVSGHDTDKSGIFKSFFSSVGNAPMVEECPVNILCKVVQTVYMPTQPKTEIFIGEVEEVYVNNKCMSDGVPDLNKIKPLMLAGTQYVEISGNPVGTAWKIGKDLIEK
jgi:flavin reductase (DIM6/NTAB) family NADH-FMN oxidoreductase RutF